LFGWSVALSADGDTALVGGPKDNGSVGAAWVFTRSGSAWSQQGPKLTGAGESGGAEFGYSVALCAARDTAVMGGPTEGSLIGAAWVFTRSGSTWTQQGPKLLASPSAGLVDFGFSVSVSANGNIALIGGPGHEAPAGAAWVFTRSRSTWTQRAKLTGGAEEAGRSDFGENVALAANAKTALIGGPGDNGDIGAAWVFQGSGSSRTRQGPKLLAGEESGDAGIGDSVVAVSTTGDTALIGGSGEERRRAVRFRRGLSANGETALIGGSGDDENVGAAWVFTRATSE
jgi:hypothetical protein